MGFIVNTLFMHLVPVVMGAQNIEEFEPYPGSVIKASDFPNPKALAEYLTMLANNDKLYEKFHRWRTMPLDQLNPKYQEMVRSKPACQLCEKLHAPITPKTIKDEDVWSVERECEPTRTKWEF